MIFVNDKLCHDCWNIKSSKSSIEVWWLGKSITDDSHQWLIGFCHEHRKNKPTASKWKWKKISTKEAEVIVIMEG